MLGVLYTKQLNVGTTAPSKYKQLFTIESQASLSTISPLCLFLLSLLLELVVCTWYNLVISCYNLPKTHEFLLYEGEYLLHKYRY